MNLKPINEQVVVITGASSGIGRDAALKFAARGEEGLKSLVDEINREGGGEAIYEICDVSDFSQVQAAAERAIKRFGRIDTWVNNAAVTVNATFEDTTLEEFRQILDVNLMGQIHGFKAALPHLRTSGGAIISVTSVESKVAMPLHSAYAASKHAIAGLLDSLRRELLHEGAPVSVTNIMPASINTPLFSKSRTKLGVKPRGLPPFYQPHIVANAILYAAAHPVRDLIVGGAGKMMISSQINSPVLTDYMLARLGFSWQRTDEPKSEAALDNLFQPVADNRVEGDFSERAKNKSFYTLLQTRPVLKTLLMVAGVSGAAMLLMHSSGKNRSHGKGIMPPPGLPQETTAVDESGSPVAAVTW